MYDEILVPTDGSDAVEPAIDEAVELARLADARIHALFVVNASEYTPVPDADFVSIEGALHEVGNEAVSTVESRCDAAGVEIVTAIREGSAREEILDYAEEQDVDLIVMGNHGRSNLDRVLLGSVTDSVIRATSRPVLVRRLGTD